MTPDAQPAAAPAAGAAATTRSRLAIFLYGAVALLYWASLFTYVPTLPTYAATLTPDLALIGTIMSMYGLWQAIIRLPVGIASDRIGWRKPFIIGGLALSAVGAIVMASAQSPQALLVGRSITGLAAATWVPLTVVFSALYPPEQAVRATTLLTLMSAIARLLATASNGPLNGIRGYGLAFFVAAILAVIAILAVMPAAEKRTPPKSMTAKSIGQLAIRQDVLLPSWLSAIAHYVLMGLVYGFVPLLAEQLGASSWVVSNLSVIHLAVFTPSVLAATFLLRKFRLRPILIVSFVLIALGVACGAVATSVGWLLAVQVFVGIGYGVSYPILLGMSIEQVDSPQRATAMGVHQSVYSIGMFAGPWLSGILAASMGLKPMFAVTAIASLVLGVLGSLWATAKRRTATGSV